MQCVGPHVGLYCRKCNKFQRWVKKPTGYAPTMTVVDDAEDWRKANPQLNIPAHQAVVTHDYQRPSADDFKKCEDCERYCTCNKASDTAARTCPKFVPDIPF